MTALLSYDFGGGSQLVSDLLISIPNSQKRSITLPMKDLRPIDSLKGIYMPAGLAQKIVTFGRWAIGWAGNQAAAKDPLRTLYDLDQSGCLRAEDVHNELSRACSMYKHKGGLAFIVQEIASNKITSRMYSSDHTPTIESDGMLIVGSGAETVRSTLDELRTGCWSQHPRYWGDPVGLAYLHLQKSLQLTGILLNDEILPRNTHGNQDASPINSMFGGGYEIAYFSSSSSAASSFKKLDDVVYMSWPADATKKHTVQFTASPHLCSIFKYFDDVLTIRVLRMAEQPATLELFIISPPYRTPSDLELSALIERLFEPGRLPIRYSCGIFPTLGTPSSPSIVTVHGDGEDRVLEFCQTKTKITFSYTQGYIEYVGAEIGRIVSDS